MYDKWTTIQLYFEIEFFCASEIVVVVVVVVCQWNGDADNRLN